MTVISAMTSMGLLSPLLDSLDCEGIFVPQSLDKYLPAFGRVFYHIIQPLPLHVEPSYGILPKPMATGFSAFKNSKSSAGSTKSAGKYRSAKAPMSSVQVLSNRPDLFISQTGSVFYEENRAG